MKLELSTKNETKVYEASQIEVHVKDGWINFTGLGEDQFTLVFELGIRSEKLNYYYITPTND